MQSRLVLHDRAGRIVVSGVGGEGTEPALGRAGTLWAVGPIAIVAAQPGRHVSAEDVFGLDGGDPNGSLTNQVVQVVEVVGRFLQPQATGLLLVAHPAVVVARPICGD